MVTPEHGKVLDDARGSVTRGMEVVEFAAGIPQLSRANIPRASGAGWTPGRSGSRSGVCAGVGPFNFPAMIPLWMAPRGDRLRQHVRHEAIGAGTFDGAPPGRAMDEAGFRRVRARAAKLGAEPGGDIMIHGLPDEQAAFGPAHRDYDWTNGCIAVTNQEIEELWRVIRDGTPIQIKP